MSYLRAMIRGTSKRSSMQKTARVITFNNRWLDLSFAILWRSWCLWPLVSCSWIPWILAETANLFINQQKWRHCNLNTRSQQQEVKFQKFREKHTFDRLNAWRILTPFPERERWYVSVKKMQGCRQCLNECTISLVTVGRTVLFCVCVCFLEREHAVMIHLIKS